jgi:hypothetical protein
MSWFDRLFRRDNGGTRPEDEERPAYETAQAEILDAEGWHTINLHVTATRVSDAINAEAAELVPRFEDGTAVDLDDVLMLVPPDHPSGDPSRRLHRPVHQLWVRMGDRSVVGSLHVPPGAAGSAYLLRRSHQFFVMTNAKVTRSVPDGREERQVPVLLVNLHQVSSLRDTPEPERASFEERVESL